MEKSKIRLEILERVKDLTAMIKQVALVTSDLISSIITLSKSALLSLSHQKSHYLSLLRTLSSTDSPLTHKDFSKILQTTQISTQFKVIKEIPILTDYYTQPFFQDCPKWANSTNPTVLKSLIDKSCLIQDCHTDLIVNIFGTSNDKYLISASQDKSLRIFNRCSNTLEKKNLIGNNWIGIGVVSPDNNNFFYATLNRKVMCWNFEIKKEWVFADVPWNIYAIALSNDSNQLFIAGNNANVWICDVRLQKKISQIHSKYFPILDIKLTIDGKFALTLCKNGIYIWDLKKNNSKHNSCKIPYSFTNFELACNSKFIVLVHSLTTLHALNIYKNRPPVFFKLLKSPKIVIASQKYKKVYFEQSGISEWDIKKNSISPLYCSGNNVKHLQTLLTSDETFLISLCSNGQIIIFNIYHSIIEFSIEHANGRIFVSNSILVYSDINHSLNVVELASHHFLHTFEGHPIGLISICLSNDNNFFASCGNDKVVRVWDLIRKKYKVIIGGNYWLTTQIRFSWRNLFLVMLDSDSQIKMWSFEENKVVK